MLQRFYQGTLQIHKQFPNFISNSQENDSKCKMHIPSWMETCWGSLPFGGHVGHSTCLIIDVSGIGRVTGVCFQVHFALTDFPCHVQPSGFYQHSTCSFLSWSGWMLVRKSAVIDDLYIWHVGETHRAWKKKEIFPILSVWFHSIG